MLRADNIKTILFTILCITSIFYLFMGIYGYMKDKKSKITIRFFLLCISLTLFAIGCAFMLISPNIRIANIWRLVSTLGVCFSNALLISFTFSFNDTNQKSSSSKIQFLLYIASIILFTSNLMYEPSKVVSNGVYGFVVSYIPMTSSTVFGIYSLVCTIVSFVTM